MYERLSSDHDDSLPDDQDGQAYPSDAGFRKQQALDGYKGEFLKTYESEKRAVFRPVRSSVGEWD